MNEHVCLLSIYNVTFSLTRFSDTANDCWNVGTKQRWRCKRVLTSSLQVLVLKAQPAGHRWCNCPEHDPSEGKELAIIHRKTASNPDFVALIRPQQHQTSTSGQTGRLRVAAWLWKVKPAQSLSLTLKEIWTCAKIYCGRPTQTKHWSMYAEEAVPPPPPHPHPPRQPGLKSTVTDRDVRDNAGKVTVDCLIDSHVFGVWL